MWVVVYDVLTGCFDLHSDAIFRTGQNGEKNWETGRLFEFVIRRETINSIGKAIAIHI